MSEKFIVGIGMAEVEFTDSLFPGPEGYTGVHDPMGARCLYVENGGRALIVTIDQSSIMSETNAAFLNAAMAASGLAAEEIWIAPTHNFACPHIWDAGHPRISGPEDAEANVRHRIAFTAAVKSAVEMAIANKKPAKLGHGTAVCNINVSRDIPTAEGWWTGHNPEEVSDKNVNVLKFEDAETGALMGVLFNYNMQSAAMFRSGCKLMSSDVCGAAVRYVEAEYGVPAVYMVGACGDQVPMFQAFYNEVDSKGVMREVHTASEVAFGVMELMGKDLGSAVVRAVRRIDCVEVPEVKTADATLVCDRQKTDPSLKTLKPSLEYTYVVEGTVELKVQTIRLGSVGFVGAKPEITTRTALEVKADSPCDLTLVCSMVNGGQKYLADKAAYSCNKYEAMNSPFAMGAAERMVETAVELLK